MSSFATNVGAEQSISASIIKCTCGNPQEIHPDEVCPQGKRVEIGDVYYWHPNPVKRVLKRAAIKYRRWRMGV